MRRHISVKNFFYTLLFTFILSSIISTLILTVFLTVNYINSITSTIKRQTSSFYPRPTSPLTRWMKM